MENYVNQYFLKLNEFNEKLDLYSSLRKKEASFISDWSRLFVKLEAENMVCYPFLVAEGAEKSSISGEIEKKEVIGELNTIRKELIEFYSKNSKQLEQLPGDLKKRYNELMNMSIDLYHYGYFKDSVCFGNYLAKLVSCVEGEDYHFKEVFYEDEYNAESKASAVIANDGFDSNLKFSSFDKLLKYCDNSGALLMGECSDKDYGVFKFDSNARFLYWNLYVPDKLTYMTSAIASLISRRIESREENLSKEMLSSFEDEFFSSMIEQIKQNYTEVVQGLDNKILEREDECRNDILKIREKRWLISTNLLI